VRSRVLFASKLRSRRVTSLPPWPCCFQPTFAVCHFVAGPRSLASPGSSSRALLLLFRVLTESDPPVRSRERATSTFLGVPFPIATSASRVHQPMSFPRSSSFRPQRFSRSRRLAPLDALWACFIPLPRPGFTPQGLSPQPSHRDSSPRRPLVSLTALASSRVAPTVQLLSSRLQGVDPGCDPLRGAKCLAPPTPDPLSSFHSFGLFSEHLEGAFTSSPLMALATSSCV
jgi:hypothetical protein